MRKFLLLFLIFAMVMLTACSGGEAEAEEGTTAPSAGQSGGAAGAVTTAPSTVKPSDETSYVPQSEIVRLQAPLTLKSDLTASEIAFLTEWIDKGTMDVSAIDGNVNVTRAEWYIWVDRTPEDPFGINGAVAPLEKIFMVDESVLYPDSDGTHIYMFFSYAEASHTRDITKCLSVNLVAGMLTATFDSTVLYRPDPVQIQHLGFLKIEKASVDFLPES